MTSKLNAIVIPNVGRLMPNYNPFPQWCHIILSFSSKDFNFVSILCSPVYLGEFVTLHTSPREESHMLTMCWYNSSRCWWSWQRKKGQNVVLQSDAMLSSIERHYTPINKNSTGNPLFPIEHTSSWNLCDLLYQFLQPLQYQSAVTRSSWITCIKHLGLEDIVVSTKKTWETSAKFQSSLSHIIH